MVIHKSHATTSCRKAVYGIALFNAGPLAADGEALNRKGYSDL